MPEETLDLSQVDSMIYWNLGLGVLAVILSMVLVRSSCRRWKRLSGSSVGAAPPAASAYAVKEPQTTSDQNVTTQMSHLRNETQGAILTLQDETAISGRSFDTPLESPLGTAH